MKEDFIAKVIVNIPNDLHEKILKLADNDKSSVSHVIKNLIGIGLLVYESKNKCGYEVKTDT